ncbi:MAG: DUF885 family protein, partial [Silvibacterium sp.]
MNRQMIAAVLVCGGLMAAQANAQTAGDNFRHLADEYFLQVTFRFAPTSGTLAGLHQYDPVLEDYSRAGVERELAALKDFEAKFDAVDGTKLDLSTQGDLEMVRNNIRGDLLELETIRGWEKDPDNYSSGIAGSAFSLMERRFARPDDRLRSLIAREKLMPAALMEARKNLKDPPRIYTEIALEQLPDIISFFENDVPSAFSDAKDASTISEFQKTNAAVIAALKDYEQWVKTDLLPRSNGDFKIGAETYSKKLKYDEMVDTPLPKLLEIAYANLHKNQAEFARIAKEVDPSKTPKQVLAELAADHPAPDKLLQTFHDRFNSEVAFINSHHIITIPSTVQPVLEETPPFMRATTQASMDSPGPFEKHST